MTQTETQTLTGITVLGRLLSSRGVSAFLLIALVSPVIVGASIWQMYRFASGPDIGFHTQWNTTQIIEAVTGDWEQLTPGDVVESVNGQPTRDFDAYWAAWRSVRVGARVTVQVRSGTTLVSETKVIGPVPVWQRLIGVLRILSGAMLLVIGLGSFVLKPGTRVSWLHLMFVFPMGAMLLLVCGEAVRPYPYVYDYAVPLLVLVSLTGLALFESFPKPLWANVRTARRFSLARGTVGAVLSLLYIMLLDNPRYWGLAEVACRLFSLGLGSGIVVVVAIGAVRARAVVGPESERLRSQYRLLITGAAAGLVLPLVATGLVRALGASGSMFEVAVIPTIVFGSCVAWAVIRYNSLDADKHTASVLGYAMTVGVLGLTSAVVLVGLPWALAQFGITRSSEATIGVMALALFSFSGVYRAIRARINRRFQIGDSGAMHAEVLRGLMEQMQTSRLDQALEAVVAAAKSIGAERAELWLLDSKGQHFVQQVPALVVSAETSLEHDRPSFSKTSPLGEAVKAGPGGVAPLSPVAFTPPLQSELWRFGLVMSVPIRAHGAAIGFLAVARKTSGFAYSTDDLALMQTLALHAAFALERGDAVKHVGRYRIERRLNVGGTAEVFLAWQLGPGGFEKKVALKRLLPDIAKDKRAAAMLLDEARIAAMVRHPHVAEVYEVGEDLDSYFIALELVTGYSLRQLIGASRQTHQLIPPRVLGAIARAVLLALDHAHALSDSAGKPMNIVHRDVTPANIMVSPEGVVKLLDFGIAKGGEQLFHTQTGAVRGTLPYMSPEQMRGEPVGPRSDVFSAAATFYELLTLSRAFPNGPVAPPLPASSQRPDLPRAVDRVFDAALTFDVESRTTSGARFVEAFTRATGPVASVEEVGAWVRVLEVQVNESAPAKVNAETVELRPPTSTHG